MLFCRLLFLSFVLNSYSESQPIIEVGACDAVVSDFLTELAINKKRNETVSACEKVTNCFESLNTDNSKKLAKLYRERCEKYKFIAHGALDCYWEMFRYNSDYDCDLRNDEQLTDVNSNKKREAFIRSKPCILKLANERCPANAENYLKSNFDEFVNYIVADTKNETCESVSVELKRTECWNLRRIEGKDWYRNYKWYNGLSDVPNTTFSEGLCEKIKKCNDDPCNIHSYHGLLQNCEIIEKLGSNFYSCLRDSSGSLHPVSVKSCGKNDKECIRKTIMKNCKVNETEFDQNYEWFNKYDMRKLYKIEIDEFKRNETDFSDPQRNGVVADQFVGKCAPLVDELVTFLSREDEYGYYKNSRLANETCSKVMECYQSTNVDKSLQASIKQMCDIVEMNAMGLYWDLLRFYEMERDKGHHFENHDYFSRNLTRKREAFASSQANMTFFAKIECGRRTEKLMQLNYGKFLDWMTKIPESNTCKSVFGLTENVHCVKNIDNLVNIINFDRLMGEDAVKIIEECQLFNKCIDGALCPNVQIFEISHWCQSAPEKRVYFSACVERVRLEETDYSCSDEEIIQETTAEHHLRQFKSSPECLKQLMEKRCGEEAVEGFDENFEHVLNRDD